jgi:hypothetical protein
VVSVVEKTEMAVGGGRAGRGVAVLEEVDLVSLN